MNKKRFEDAELFWQVIFDILKTIKEKNPYST